jgi:hypothetical protein
MQHEQEQVDWAAGTQNGNTTKTNEAGKKVRS